MMETLVSQTELYLVCGVINILATVSYITNLYILREFAFTFTVTVTLATWEVLLFLIFTLDSVLHLAASFNKMGFIFSFTGVTDMISLLAIICFLLMDFYTALTLQFVRCFKLLKILQGVKSYPQLFGFLFVDSVHYEILHTVISILVLLLFVTGVVQAVSHQYPESFESPSLHQVESHHADSLLWHECLYFVIVTVTTVGFGDIYPLTTLTRMLMVLIMVIAFTLIPTLLSDLVRALYSQPQYSGSLSLPMGRKHIVICGIVNSAMLLQLLLELQSYPFNVSSNVKESNELLAMNWIFRSQKSEKGEDILVAILSPCLPNQKVKLLLDSVLAIYARRIMYFVGSTKVAHDLQRVKAEDALAILILGDESTTSMRVEEDSIFLSAISISNYLEHSLFRFNDSTSQKKSRPHIVSSLTHTAKLKPLLHSAGVNIVLPFQQFKYSLLGVSAACPGFMAIFMKLNRPHFESYAQQYPHYLSDTKTHYASYSTPTTSSLDNIPYLKSSGTEHSIIQISMTSIFKGSLNCPAASRSTLESDLTVASLDKNNHYPLTEEKVKHQQKPTLSLNLDIQDDSNKRIFLSVNDDIRFSDVVSVAFRLSLGEVVLIGGSTFVGNDKNNSMHFGIKTNSGSNCRIKEFSDLFLIAKSREIAVRIVKRACQSLQRGTPVKGPKGSSALGTLESLNNNLLFLSISHDNNAEQLKSQLKTPAFSRERNCMADFWIPENRTESDDDVKSNDHLSKSDDNIYDSRSDLNQSASSEKDKAVSWNTSQNPSFDKSEDAIKFYDNSSCIHRHKNEMYDLLQQSSLNDNSLSPDCKKEEVSRFKKLSPFVFHPNDDDAMSVSTAGRVPMNSTFAKSRYRQQGNASMNRFRRAEHKRQHRNQYKKSSKSSKIDKENKRHHKGVIKTTSKLKRSGSPITSFVDINTSNSSNSDGDSRGYNNALHNHMVLILSSSGTKDTISAHALLLPVIHILKTYRTHSADDSVLVLSERADELHAVATDNLQFHAPVLRGVNYYLGTPRNIDHLRLCSVVTARVVVIFHHPTPAAVLVEGDDDPTGQTIPRKLNSDRHTIIISLNLHFLLEKQCRSLPSSNHTAHWKLRNDNFCRYTFTIAEVRHESNVAYLRRSIKTISSVTTVNEEKFQNSSNSNLNVLDLLSAGGVLTAPVFMSLLLQSILNPYVIMLWEYILTGTTTELLCETMKSKVEKQLSHHIGEKSGGDVTTKDNNLDFETKENNIKFSSLPKTFFNQSETLGGGGEEIPIMGRILCPRFYVGKHYGILFEDLLEYSGIVSLGVHRLMPYQTSNIKSTMNDLNIMTHNIADVPQEIAVEPMTSSSNDNNNKERNKSENQQLSSAPYTYIAPSINFILGPNDYILILRKHCNKK